MSEQNHAETISDLTLRAIDKPEVFFASGDREFVLVPQTGGAYKLENISRPHTAEPPIPTYTSQLVDLQTEQSMIDYLNRFKNIDSAMFADMAHDTIVGIIDYHRAAVPPEVKAAADVGAVQPRLKAHRATLKLPKSVEWATWAAKDNRLMSHLEFVDFLEENSVDIIDPPGGELIELCRDLQATRNVKFGSFVRAGDYEKIDYSKDGGAVARGSVSIPVSITINIPVYFGDKPITMKALFRRKVDDDGALKLGYKLMRPENVRQDRFKEVVSNITFNTGTTVTVYGSAS